MDNLRKQITDFIFLNGNVAESDAIFCTGTSFASIPEYAASLYHKGVAPLIFVGGKYSITKGCFAGVADRADLYNQSFSTEAEFYAHVLTRNGVPENAILAEHESTYTKENAVFARRLAEENGIAIKRALLLCHSFHARRAYMYYTLSFPESEIIPVGVPFPGVTPADWHKSEMGISRVMGELSRIGEQFSLNELERLLK